MLKRQTPHFLAYWALSGSPEKFFKKFSEKRRKGEFPANHVPLRSGIKICLDCEFTL
jgi:hypothetical protein